MNYFHILVIFTCLSGQQMVEITLPYNKEMTHCYEHLSKTNEEYRDAFAELRKIASQSLSFEERLRKISERHEAALRKGKAVAQQQPWREEDAYVCCVYDLHEAVFAKEVERILTSSGETEAKSTLLRNMMKSLEGVPFGSPQWNTRIKLRIQKNIKEGLSGLSKKSSGGNNNGK